MPHAHEVFTQFSNISYYKVNFCKSLLLNLNAPLRIKITLQNQLPYSWAVDGIPYLSITLTPRVSFLAHANCKPLLSKLATVANSSLKLICHGLPTNTIHLPLSPPCCSLPILLPPYFASLNIFKAFNLYA